MRRFFRLVATFLILILVFSPLLWAQKEEAQRKIIKYVDVRNNKTVSGATILSKLKTKKGDYYQEKIVNEDVKRLYLLGYFSDVAVHLEDVDDGVRVIFEVTEKGSITSIQFRGNKIYKTEKLKQTISSKLNEFADEKTLKKDAMAIVELYEKKGYPWVTVSYKIDIDEKSNHTEVIFVIKEGSRAVVRKIKILGNTAFSDKRIFKIIKSRTSGFLRSGVYKKDVLEDDMERIKHFYRQDGYLDIGSSYEVEFREKGKKKWIEVAIEIEEGRKYLAGERTISGNAVFSHEELRSLLELKEGDTFTESALHKDVSAIQEHYFDSGYIMARVQPDTLLNLKTDKVDITYNITEGEVCYINKIDIRGNTKTKDVVIRRELRIKPGERYDGTKLRRSKERLYNLGFFEEIVFDTEDTALSNKKDMVVEVKESKTGEFSFGGGFSSIDKLIGFVEIEQRNFDFKNFPTFTGDGQDLKLRAEFGTVREDYYLSWTEPWIFDRPLSFGFDAYSTTRNRSGSTGYAYDEERQGGNLRLGKEFSEYLRGSLTYRIERIDISDLSSDASEELRDEEGENTISSLMLQVARDTRNNRFNPDRGLLLTGSLELAGGFIGGDKDFVKFFDSASRYSTIGPFVLELKLRDGVVGTYGDSGKVPVYERFFAGGTHTVRGYKERDVGPKDQSGDPIGGGTMFVSNAELTFSIIENLKGAFFIDAGNVWYRPDSKPESGAATRGIKVGVGAGVRIKTPIGPVRLDLGYPVNPDDNQEDKARFHFSMSRGF